MEEYENDGNRFDTIQWNVEPVDKLCKIMPILVGIKLNVVENKRKDRKFPMLPT